MTQSKYNTLKELKHKGKSYQYYSIPSLEAHGFNVKKLPVSIRIILESVLRNLNTKDINESHLEKVANWSPNATRTDEIPLVVSRIVLQDFTGIPLLVDLASMRDATKTMHKNPKLIEPLIPVDLIIDHSVQVDYYGTENSLKENTELDFKRNHERYQFLKWGMESFNNVHIVPSGNGIVHQVNLEYLFRGIHHKNSLLYPDTLIGTDSHTTMINGVGVVGWGVGGIEAEVAMLGQAIFFLAPDVVGVKLLGKLNPGVTGTDLVLTITELLRKTKVVGKFVEFYGEGAKNLTVQQRATIGNMAPECGATINFFPPDEATVLYMKNTGKSEEECELFEQYFKAQEMFGINLDDSIAYTQTITLNLADVKPSIAGPKRPQDRISLVDAKTTWQKLFVDSKDGFNKKSEELTKEYPVTDNPNLKHGDVLIAAITSCTNTSNPEVLIAAGILAKKAVENGLTVNSKVKTSLAPGSLVVTEYLKQSGLLPFLEKLGFYLVGYGCTTCIGNSGDLKAEVNDSIIKNDLVCAAVLSGNRNFEARIHQNIKANFLASPPLVVAYALAGNMNFDFETEALGITKDGKKVFLKDIWPSHEEIAKFLPIANDAAIYKKIYSNINSNLLWNNLASTKSECYPWPDSTYINKPPYFENFSLTVPQITNITNAKVLLILGDSITTDHISPAGGFTNKVPAGAYLESKGVASKDFNSYGARRGNHEVMMRGTFANVRIKNLMLTSNNSSIKEGGYTVYDNKELDVYSAAMQYKAHKIATIVIAGEEYGSGSSRDWAAKGPYLLGVKAIIAKSFERIHRSNLLGMGILPLQFLEKDSAQSLKLTGQEIFNITLNDSLKPQEILTVNITYANGEKKDVKVLCRIDTPIEINFYKHGGILNYALRGLLSN